MFQRPVLFTERLSSVTLTITAARDEQSAVRKFQAFREVLKWQNYDFKAVSRAQLKFQECLAKDA